MLRVECAEKDREIDSRDETDHLRQGVFIVDVNALHDFGYIFLWLLNLHVIFAENPVCDYVSGSLRLLMILSVRSNSLSLAQFMALVVFCLVALWLGCKASL